MNKILVLVLMAFGSLMLTVDAHAKQAQPKIVSSQAASSSTNTPTPTPPQRYVPTLDEYSQKKCTADYYQQHPRPKDTYKNFMASCTKTFVARVGRKPPGPTTSQTNK